MLQNFYSMHIKLLKVWGEFDEKQFCFGSKPNLFCYLPESLMIDTIECITEILKNNPKGSLAFNSDFIITLIELCMMVVRT